MHVTEEGEGKDSLAFAGSKAPMSLAIPRFRTLLLLTANFLSASVLHGSSWVHRGPSSPNVQDIAAITDSNTVFAATTGGLFRSLDAGDSWTRISEIPRTYLRDVAVDPADSRFVYASGSTGIFRSIDSGDRWSKVSGGLPVGSILALEIDPFRPSVLWASISNQGLYRSSDRGDSWAPAHAGLVLASSILTIQPVDGSVYVAGGGGIYTSNDGGGTWSLLPALPPPSQILSIFAYPDVLLADTSSGLYKRTNGTWTLIERPAPPLARVASFAFEPSSGALYAGTEDGRVFLRIDAENRWIALGSDTFGASVPALAAVRNGPGTTRFFAGVALRGVFRSVDGGNSWLAASAPLDTSQVASIAIDPATGHIYAAAGGVFRSVDHGETWTRLNMPSYNVVSVFFNQGAIVAATWSDGVFRSTDNGATWQAMGGQKPTLIRSIEVDPRDPRRLAAVTANGLYLAADGEHWTRPPGFSSVSGMAFDAVDPQTMLLTPGSGIWRSTDGGTTFLRFGTAPTDSFIRKLVNDPIDPDRIYAAGISAGLWVSVNRGQTWSVLDGRIIANAFLFLSSSEMYISSGSNGIFKSVDGGHHWDVAVDDFPDWDVTSMTIEPQPSRDIWLGTTAGVFRPITSSRRRAVRH